MCLNEMHFFLYRLQFLPWSVALGSFRADVRVLMAGSYLTMCFVFSNNNKSKKHIKLFMILKVLLNLNASMILSHVCYYTEW